MNVEAVADCLVMLLVANGAPIIARNLLGQRFSWPVDSGALWTDDRPWFGPAKTWRGVTIALFATAAVAPIVGRSPALGAQLALLTMVGDLISSFVKRRLGKASSESATLVDEVPEAALPAWALSGAFGFSALDLLVVVVGFTIADITLSRALRWLGIRR